ncbi:MAG: cysteine desulfurase family protein [Erysipelotrichaceae bacterium]
MFYFDYAAHTPTDPLVLDTYVKLVQEYGANPNSNHPAGLAGALTIAKCSEQIKHYLQLREHEIIYTSGASEANNQAIKGCAQSQKGKGKHIITTFLEHASVHATISSLVNQGFEVEYVDVLQDGRIDLDHLEELLRDDTILVSTVLVDSELGIAQDLAAIHHVLQRFPNAHWHVDATQAIGKGTYPLHLADLISFSAHKFYGLVGTGALMVHPKVCLEPIIHGGHSTTQYRAGTPDVAGIGAMVKALELAIQHQAERIEHVTHLQTRLVAGLKTYDDVVLNNSMHSTPFVVNVSLTRHKAEAMQAALGEKGVYVVTKSACCAVNTVSKAVYALTHNRKRALSTLRISLSHLSTTQDIEALLAAFEESYNNIESR